jgi:hypothetical protein
MPSITSSLARAEANAEANTEKTSSHKSCGTLASRQLSSEEYNEECPIALEFFKELAEKNDLAMTKCGHKFSHSELKKWLESHATCPTCYAENIQEQELTNVSLKTQDAAKESLASASASTPKTTNLIPPPPPPPVVIRNQFVPIIKGVRRYDLTTKEALDISGNRFIDILNTATNQIVKCCKARKVVRRR